MQKNELYDLIDAVVECADKVSKLGRLLKEFVPQFAELPPQINEDVPVITKAKTDSKPKTEETVKEPEKQIPAYSFEDVRKAFAAKSHAGHTAEVKALIQKYGAGRLSDVQESDYPKLMADLEVI